MGGEGFHKGDGNGCSPRIFLVLWQCGQRVKRGHSTEELRMIWGIRFGGSEGDMKIYSYPTCFPGWSSLWVPWDCSFGLFNSSNDTSLFSQLCYFFFLIIPKSGWGCPYVHECRAIHWSIGNQPVATPTTLPPLATVNCQQLFCKENTSPIMPEDSADMVDSLSCTQQPCQIQKTTLHSMLLILPASTLSPWGHCLRESLKQFIALSTL